MTHTRKVDCKIKTAFILYRLVFFLNSQFCFFLNRLKRDVTMAWSKHLCTLLSQLGVIKYCHLLAVFCVTPSEELSMQTNQPFFSFPESPVRRTSIILHNKTLLLSLFQSFILTLMELSPFWRWGWGLIRLRMALKVALSSSGHWREQTAPCLSLSSCRDSRKNKTFWNDSCLVVFGAQSSKTTSLAI